MRHTCIHGSTLLCTGTSFKKRKQQQHKTMRSCHKAPCAHVTLYSLWNLFMHAGSLCIVLHIQAVIYTVSRVSSEARRSVMNE